MYRYLWKHTIVPFILPQKQIPMKFTFRIAIVFLLLLGCENEDKLTFTPLVLEQNDCDDCPVFSIQIPEAQGKTALALAINRAVEEEIIALLLFEEEEESNTMEDAMRSFKTGYTETKKRFSGENTPWEATIKGNVRYEDTTHLTVELTSYIFTGGAHGYNAHMFLNFDKKKGKEIEAWELFTDQEDFQNFAEQKFREKESIPADKSINHTGLMFEKDRFYLPENIGFTEQGIQLLYNPYEVASYADGPIVLTLPFEEVRPYLASPTKS